MKIILKENVEKLGQAGELKEVSRGYARNFLFPQNLAMPATKNATEKISAEIKGKEADEKKLQEEARKKASQLENKKITISVKAEEGGKLFGAISEKEVVINIKKQIGLDLDPKDIKITDPIKKIGDYKIKITLYKDIRVSVDIKVTAEK